MSRVTWILKYPGQQCVLQKRSRCLNCCDKNQFSTQTLDVSRIISTAFFFSSCFSGNKVKLQLVQDAAVGDCFYHSLIISRKLSGKKRWIILLSRVWWRTKVLKEARYYKYNDLMWTLIGQPKHASWQQTFTEKASVNWFDGGGQHVKGPLFKTNSDK